MQFETVWGKNAIPENISGVKMQNKNRNKMN